MRFDLVVVDMDDTIYLERDYVRSGFLAVDGLVQREFGVPGFSNIAWNLFEGGARGDTFDRTLERMGLLDVDVHDLVACYRHHSPDIAMTSDSTHFLESLIGRVPIALITDGPPASQRNKMRVLGVDRYLDEAIVTYEHDGTWHKPNPTAFRYLQAKFQANPSACIYIADNPSKDFRAPEVLGWQTLRIRRPASLHFFLESTVEELEEFPGKTWIRDHV